MKESLERTWEGTGIEEFKDASIDAYVLLTKTSDNCIFSIFNSKSIYRHIDIVVESEDHTYRNHWSNYAYNGIKSKIKFVRLQNDIIHCFNCETISSFRIYVEFVKE